jgi:hypothetical protein
MAASPKGAAFEEKPHRLVTCNLQSPGEFSYLSLATTTTQASKAR